MDRVSAWRFINPPMSFVKGMLVNRKGNRFSNEQFYGAKTSERMAEEHGGVGILIIDSEIWKKAHGDLRLDRAQWFQAVPNIINLYLNDKKANTIEELAVKYDIPPENLRQTLESYNTLAKNDGDDPLGKSKDFFKVLKPPYHAIDCSIGSLLYSCATITLGGLVVNEETGEVQREDGSVISGLYAAGRTAVGITSNGYVSGLSIADAVYSGRRAGNHAAAKSCE
jgi:3-oxo-5alpha-steroid 4-dehydrogenase